MRDLETFFASLVKLAPEDSFLCLAGAAWSKEGREFVRDHAASPGEPPQLPREFNGEPCFPISRTCMDRLADMATRHAAPELAADLAVFARGERLLEWFDVPDDPMTASMSVPEERVADFAEVCGVTFTSRSPKPSEQDS